MKLIIDRFERDYAVCEKEDRTMVNIERSKIPPEAREGDVLKNENNTYVIDYEEINKRKEKIRKLMNDLFE